MIYAGVIGGSGYTGNELLRLLTTHPKVEVKWVCSRSYAGRKVSDIHPNLRGFIDIRFVEFKKDIANDVDIVFLCLPHTVSMNYVKDIFERVKIVDLSADFRLKNHSLYEKYYTKHICPELIKNAVYGLPEIHRNEIENSSLVANPGCNATACILALYPLKEIFDRSTKIIVDIKEGSSASGRKASLSSIHAERSSTVRVYKPKGHRHVAEIVQETGFKNIAMSAHAVDMPRGVFATIYIEAECTVSEKDLWKVFRKYYKDEPFVRIVKRRNPPYNLPDIKGVAYSNFCDIGFVVDEECSRVIIFSALDNLIKGSAGQAIQNMNVMFGFDETTGLKFPGFLV